MKVKEIAKQAGVCEGRVYQLARSLNRLPTVEEVIKRKGRKGRPRKWGIGNVRQE